MTMYCYVLEFMSLNNGLIELGMRSRPTSVEIVLNPQT